MSSGTVTIYSKRDPESGQAVLEDCTLVTGFGPVRFLRGQAEVTPEQATILARSNPSIELRNGGGYLEANTVAAPAGPALPLGLQDASPDELDFSAAAIAAVRDGPDAWAAFAEALPVFAGWTQRTDDPPAAESAGLQGERDADDDGGEPEPAPAGGAPAADADDPDTPRAEDLNVEPSIAAAMAMLRDEGEHVPKALPAGFEVTTGEGEPRCYARLGAGTQCTNPAKLAGEHSTYACGLPKHVAQVAKLP